MRPQIGAAKLPILPIAHGEAAFCVTGFHKVKFSASGKFPWIHQSEQRKLPMTVPEVSSIGE